MSRRILYLQYTNPAGYPPLLHSSALLAERGWQVLFAGIRIEASADLVLPQHENVRHLELGSSSGSAPAQARYAAFATRSLLAAIHFKPDWCYASDALGAPAALMVRNATGARVAYHEHDAPAPGTLHPLVLRARNRLAATADMAIAPAAARLVLIPAGAGNRYVVWNCPRREEAAVRARQPECAIFSLVYHGSLSRDRLTPQFVDALSLLPEHVHLHIYGYETAGHRGYAAELMQRATTGGVGHRVHYHGAIPERASLLGLLRGHQLGIATVAPGAADQNLQSLAGASNKAFEYLALGLPLLISRAVSWQELYLDPGYAVDCEPGDAASIAAAVRPLCAEPARAWRMGEAGRMRVLAEWNYEAQFAPVLAELSA